MENLQGVCKDCGNGTLNNELNPAFEVVSVDTTYWNGQRWVESEYQDSEALVCNRCGSTHLDVL